MKGKQLIGMAIGLASVCSLLYRAPQIMDAVGGGKAGLACGNAEPGGGVPVGGVPGSAVSGLLQAIGKQPMPNGDLAALGIHISATDDVSTSPDASNLRIFGANLTDAEAQKALERAAKQHPAKSISGGKVATNDAASATKKLKQAPKVVVHKPEE
ncbi:MAG: hypothetical protein ACKVZJ_14555 [Phycisphaerales bacterium]